MQTLSHLAALRLTGDDSRSFLQGQLSQDLLSLTPERMQLASCNSAQGRVQAVVWLIERNDGLWLLMSASLLDTTLTRLRKYLLRAKCRIEDTRANWQLCAAGPEDLQDLHWPSLTPGAHQQHQHSSVIRWPDSVTERYLVLQPSDTSNISAAPSPTALEMNVADQAWLLADIRAGLPQVFTETHESFVAQMLNLDLLDGISFGKGCYTGQEIIARAHYRGTVKRRMYRMAARCEPPTPGTRILTQAGHAGDVVMSVTTEQGCELLAVINLGQLRDALRLDGMAECGLTLQELPYTIDAT